MKWYWRLYRNWPRRHLPWWAIFSLVIYVGLFVWLATTHP